MSTLVITEGVAWMWHYHISKEETSTRGLCGAPTMRTAMRMSAWKVPFGEHFPKRPTWCHKCDAMKEKSE